MEIPNSVPCFTSGVGELADGPDREILSALECLHG